MSQPWEAHIESLRAKFPGLAVDLDSIQVGLLRYDATVVDASRGGDGVWTVPPSYDPVPPQNMRQDT
ncbi:MAG: hypothetical protein JWM93_2479 [Frankiales bacterium]|nr:hypothetical protein [Frankiales bacterium]